jgi:hypothetical protein
MILRELVTRIGFELDDTNLKKFELAISTAKEKLADLGNVVNKVKTGIIAIGAAGAGLTALSLSVAKSTKSTQALADQLGITSTDLQQLELVAQSTGIEVNDLNKSFSRFNTNLGNIDGSVNVTTTEMRKLGISLRDTNGNLKSSFELYQEAANKIDAIKNPIKQAAAAQKLFGTSNLELVKLFSQSNESFQKQREEIAKLGYVIDSKGVKSSEEFIKSWNNLKIIIDGVKKELAVKFMPVFSEAIELVKDWYLENKEVISQGIDKFINAVTWSFSLLKDVIGFILSPIKKLIELFGGLENTVRILGVALAVVLTPAILAMVGAVVELTVAILANPLTWWIGLLTAVGVAIGLIIDDLYNWSQGNNSLIASLLKDWFGFEATFDQIIDNITNYFKDQFTALGKWFSSFFEGITKTISSITDFIGSGLDKVRENTIFRKVVEEKSIEQKIINLSDPNIFKEDKPIFDQSKILAREIKLVDESNLIDEEPLKREIKLIDESNLIDQDTLDLERKINLVTQESLNNNNALPQNNLNSFDMVPLKPIMVPSESIAGNSLMQGNKINNKVNQYITENITINVPTGTTVEQTKVISTQIANEIQEQFNYNILRGMDSLSDR